MYACIIIILLIIIRKNAEILKDMLYIIILTIGCLLENFLNDAFPCTPTPPSISCIKYKTEELLDSENISDQILRDCIVAFGVNNSSSIERLDQLDIENFLNQNIEPEKRYNAYNRGASTSKFNFGTSNVEGKGRKR